MALVKELMSAILCVNHYFFISCEGKAGWYEIKIEAEPAAVVAQDKETLARNLSIVEKNIINSTS